MPSIMVSTSKGIRYILLKTVPSMKQIMILFCFGEEEKVVNKMLKPTLTVLIATKIPQSDKEEVADQINVGNLGEYYCSSVLTRKIKYCYIIV